jgi:hypothetical protein
MYAMGASLIPVAGCAPPYTHTGFVGGRSKYGEYAFAPPPRHCTRLTTRSSTVE